MILFQHIPIWGWWFGTWFVWLSHILGNFIIPNWGTHIFQRGRAQPPTSMIPTIVGGSDPTMPIYLAPNNAKPRLKLLLVWAMQKWFSVENLIEPTDSRLNSEDHCLQSSFPFKKIIHSSIRSSQCNVFPQNCVPALSMVCFNIKSSCP